MQAGSGRSLAGAHSLAFVSGGRVNAFLRQLRPAFLALVAFTVICGLAYPLAVTAIARVGWKDKANGSLIERNGVVVGSTLLGQQFTSPQYFHPRPSAAGDGYDGAASSGSNFGPTNEDYLSTVADRVAAYREENGLGPTELVPVDAVTASGSGLDPEISVRNAELQAPRVAEARGVELDDVLALIKDHTSERPLGFLGDTGVNVLELNLALDG
jgi:potassium-transporting ATPase KdpC subunit